MRDRTVLHILTAAIKERGFDGLYCEDNECSCALGDLAPCDGIQPQCTMGYKRTCPECHQWGVYGDAAGHCGACGFEPPKEARDAK